MKAIYCSDSQNRIPIEYFGQGKAIWHDGRPYLKHSAERLGLKPDPAPPPEFVAMVAMSGGSGRLKAGAVAVPPAGPVVPPAAPWPVPERALEKPAPIPAPVNPPKPKEVDIESTVIGKIAGKAPRSAPDKPAISQRAARLNSPTETLAPKPAPVPPAAPAASPAPVAPVMPVAPIASIEPIAAVAAVAPVPPPAAAAVPPDPLSVTPLASVQERPTPPAEKLQAAPPKPLEKPREVCISVPTLVEPLNVAALLGSKARNKSVQPAAPSAPSPAVAQAAPVPPPVPAAPVAASAPAKPPPARPAGPPKPVAAVPKPALPTGAAPAKPAAPEGAKANAPAAAVDAKAAAPKKEVVRVLAEARLERGEALSAEQLLKIPIFEGIPASQIERLPGAVVLRRFKKGEIICREGEYGSTAYYILSGRVQVYINTPMKHVKSDKRESASRSGIFGVMRRFSHGLVGRKDDPRDGEARRYIPIDAPMDLAYDDPIAELKELDLFGEMTCMSFYPRSATVRASTDCVMLEMLRNVLQVLQKNKKFKEQLSKAYRERALGQHLRSVPILSGLDDHFIDQLRNRVELANFDPGDPIVKQGDDADAFYLIRVGCVKVSQHHPGGELVLTYLGRGEYFGEMGLLKGGKRTATCTALDHVEVVKINKPDFDFMLSWYEDLRPKFEAEAVRREQAARKMTERAPGVPLDDFLGQGLMHAQSLLLLDLEKCTRCDECVRACADSHEGVTRLVREGLRFDRYLVPTSCRSCMDPVCMIGCPVGSIRRKESLEIIIEDWCIGCGICAKQCPYGNISMHPFDVQVDDPEHPGAKKAELKEKAVTCDLCTELKEPSCVYACPHDAAYRVDARQYFLGQNASGQM